MAAPALRTVRLSGTESAPTWRGRLHLLAAVVAAPLCAELIWRQRTVPMAAYAVALFSLFAVSACYHLLPVSTERRLALRRLDHLMIYLYMAAAYAPYCLYVVRGKLGWVVLTMSWVGIAAGIATKVFAFNRSRVVSGVLYVVVGWLAVVTLPEAFDRLSPASLRLLFALGALYSGGSLVLLFRRPDPVPDVFGYHEVWHGAVVLACACYFAVLWSLPTSFVHG